MELAAALFRAIKWQSVQRLIFVGDPNQLPPIGIGKVFADIIDWMRAEQPESIAELKTNVRLMENRVTSQGSGILALAGVYIHEALGVDNGESKVQAEQLLAKVQGAITEFR